MFILIYERCGKVLGNNYFIEKGKEKNIDELESLYNDLNDYLESNINYPKWAKGIYPIRETAINGIKEGSLFVLKIDDEIAGSVILNHEPEKAYYDTTWRIEADYKDIIVVRTLVVHPKYMKNGVGKKLLDFAKEYSIKEKMKAIRLDVSIHNTPAIELYEKQGYKYIDTVDLGLEYPDLKWFKLYELII